jgi:hypothetical protein
MFGDTIDKLGVVATGVKNRIGATLAPVLEGLAKQLIGFAAKYDPKISA